MIEKFKKLRGVQIIFDNAMIEKFRLNDLLASHDEDELWV